MAAEQTDLILLFQLLIRSLAACKEMEERSAPLVRLPVSTILRKRRKSKIQTHRQDAHIKDQAYLNNSYDIKSSLEAA